MKRFLSWLFSFVFFGTSLCLVITYSNNKPKDNAELSIAELQNQVTELSDNVSTLVYVLERKEEEL